MTSTGRILIIDDDPTFLRMYQRQLGEEGYLVDTAASPPAAMEKLDQGGWDVVLLDQKLQGRTGPDTGLDLIADTVRRSPGSRVILVTAYATPTAVERAFKEGAYDYLQKDELFQVLLRAKLRNAVETARAQQLGTLTSEETEAALRETWIAVERETDPHRKGKLLEDLMVLLFKTIPGFHQVSVRRRNEVEEIDLLVRNESRDPLWVNERTSYILAECKHWSKPVDVTELRSFVFKMERRYGRCRLGFFVAPGGFTEAFKLALKAECKDDLLIVLIDGGALRELVQSSDRNEILKKLHERAVVGTNGVNGH